MKTLVITIRQELKPDSVTTTVTETVVRTAVEVRAPGIVAPLVESAIMALDSTKGDISQITVITF